ncbi:AI-2E family transporter [Enterococcus dongliensis]|uniref:AI-2E family transporter n=1 Tax=Enterococcus dongliensis TaxID=2559925 RepID=A0AAP5KSG8_9ENTE|nr:AI-2E family transporter [Enterococcus dongliensis]MDT2597228.1 AI-2E family transporter [Enterococcus dongliensis]MDT2604018.1 AI-2E family transporter [Enterococcus dongliensis]MDT2634862.1 AI-2E family transporter [Enterococcus dongliensis]MDT2638007.1 AI-2E family transporter [Enterococcus dongliensis]MDT2638706.1 AI-2E family transporter [Enterococcus dongliensis]
MEKEKPSKLIQFFGGKTSYYIIGLIILSTLAIYLLNTVSFIFRPIIVIITTVLPPMIFALLLYYLLNPVVNFLSKKGLPRIVSNVLTYVVIFGLLFFGGARLIPVIQTQAQDLIKQFPDFVDDFQNGIKHILDATPFATSSDQALNSLDKLTKEAWNYLGENWQDGAKGLGTIFSAVSSTAITLFTGPIIAFFLIQNPHKLYNAVIELIPPRFRKDSSALIKLANQQLGAFLKGQVIASLLLGLIYWVVFLLLGMQFATVIALAAGILSIIPYIGSFLAFIPGVFIAFQDSTFMVVKFVIAWFVVQLLHGDLVVPRVMGDKLKIHPITILVVLLVMGDLLGLVGVIFGIPIYSMVKLLVVFAFRKFKQRYNKYFADEGAYRNTGFSEDDYL